MMKTQHNLHKTCLKIAEDNLKKLNDLDSVADKLEKERDYSLLCILLSAVALESRINKFGIEHLAKSMFKKTESSQPTLKWMAYPSRIFGENNQFNDSELLQIHNVFSKKNRLVHYKGKFTDPIKHPKNLMNGLVDDISKILNYSEAKTAYKTAKKMIDKLDKLEDELKKEKSGKN